MKKLLVLVLTLVMVIGLAGVADTTITLADDPEDQLMSGGEGEGVIKSAEAGCIISDGGLMESGEGYIIMDVDCYHAGFFGCWDCDENADYNCSEGVWGPISTCCFSDLVPEGNIVTMIEAVYNGSSCEDGMISVYVDDTLVGSGMQTGQGCSCGDCDPVTVTSADYPDGFPGYVYGGTNELKLGVAGNSCVSDVHLKLYYESALSLEELAERLAAVEAKLHGEVQPRLDALEAENEELGNRVADLEAENEELENRLAAVEAKLHGEVQPRLDALEAAEGCINSVVDWLIEHVIPSGLINQAEKKGYPMPECP